MTFGIAFSTPDYAGVVTDRRISGSVTEDDYGKCGVVEFADARLAYTFSGLARYGSINTNLWLAEALCQSGKGGIPAKGALERLCGLVAQKMRGFRVRDPHSRKLTVVFAGFQWGNGRSPRAFYMVSNWESLTESRDGTVSASFALSEAVLDVQNECIVQTIGRQVSRKDADEFVRRLADGRIPPAAALDAAVDLIRSKADAAIGKRCSSVVLPRFFSLNQLVDYHPDTATSTVAFPAYINAAYGNHGAFLLVDQMVWGSRISGGPPAILKGPALPRKAPCFCGSGQQHRRCHGQQRSTGLGLADFQFKVIFKFLATPEDGSVMAIISALGERRK